MPLTCPVCRATNDHGPGCRRCRADLSLCFAAERQRDRAMAAAQQAAGIGDLALARQAARRAAALRRGIDLRKIEAALHLLAGEYDAAWRLFRTATRIES